MFVYKLFAFYGDYENAKYKTIAFSQFLLKMYLCNPPEAISDHNKKGYFMENSLHYKLRICHTNCQKVIVSHLKKRTNLKPGEPKILEFLAEHEPCEQKQIALGCNLDPASVTGILGRMETRGLIRREIRNGNRRSLYVSMTDLGRSMVTKVEETFSFVDNHAIAGLSAAESEQFLELLDKINQNLITLGEEEKK